MIEIRKLVFLSISLGLFNACATVRNLDAADNDSVGIPTSLAITSTPIKSPVLNYSLELVVDGFQRPIYVTHSGDGTARLFVVEQNGAIYIVSGGKVLDTPFLDLKDRITR
ncbi:MAG: hypothetical protein VX237_08660, partial [Chloroflexota bacterium]|nr:hypothetical protein [Chloroflexota bacterium]